MSKVQPQPCRCIDDIPDTGTWVLDRAMVISDPDLIALQWHLPLALLGPQSY